MKLSANLGDWSFIQGFKTRWIGSCTILADSMTTLHAARVKYLQRNWVHSFAPALAPVLQHPFNLSHEGRCPYSITEPCSPALQGRSPYPNPTVARTLYKRVRHP